MTETTLTPAVNAKISGQAVRFAAVGVINTLTDIGLLNLFTRIFHSYHGAGVFGLNSLSYAIATINSYLLNKYWTFGDRSTQRELAKVSQFVILNLIGAFLNSSIVSGLTTCVAAPAGVFNLFRFDGAVLGLAALSDQVLWLNVSKLIATAFVMSLNFFLYRYWIFRSALKTVKETGGI